MEMVQQLTSENIIERQKKPLGKVECRESMKLTQEEE